VYAFTKGVKRTSSTTSWHSGFNDSRSKVRKRPKKETTQKKMTLQNEKLLVFLPIPPPAGWLEKARERFPGVDIRWEVVKLDMAGKAGMSTVADLPEETREGVTLMCTFLPEAREVMKDVRFVQLASAGSDLWAKHPVFLDPDVQFCTGSGVHA
jgi:hypothetical protein